MTSNYRELTGRERQRLRKLITTHCASYDKEYGCLPLDCDCPMFGICFTNSALCRYFRKSVLPEDAELEAVFTQFRTDKDVNVPHRLQELRHEKSPVFFPETLVPLERKYQFQVFLFPRLFRNP